MAGSEKDPPDKVIERKFICCSRKNVGVLFCILCERAFHSSCFDRKKGAREISKSFIICDKHGDVDITSKISEKALSNEAREVIA